jgi:hypothetical protein
MEEHKNKENPDQGQDFMAADLRFIINYQAKGEKVERMTGFERRGCSNIC